MASPPPVFYRSAGREGEGVPRQKTIVSHRGLSGDEPENTLEAIAASVARGVEAIEVDIRLTADGVPILFHDPSVGGAVVARSTHAELASHVPDLCTLAEAVDIIPSECLLDVEIKTPGIERAVLDVLEPRRKTSSFVITSFRDEAVAQAKALDSTIQVGLVLGIDERAKGKGTRLRELFPLRRLRRSNSDFVVVHKKLFRYGFLRRLAWLGYPVWVYTVNKPERMIRMLENADVTAIVTDRPLEAMALRDRLEGGQEESLLG